MMAGLVEKIDVTTTASGITFSQDTHLIKLENVGAVKAYIAIDTAATTNLFPLLANEIMEIGYLSITSVSCITASGTTSVLVNSAGEL